MGAASKVISVIFRLCELCMAVIVLGLTGRFLSLVSEADVYADSRLIYTTVVASISTCISILLLLPFTLTFLLFLIDFIMFVLWLVVFCLLEALTGINTCEAAWYWNYWGYYWGGFWRVPVVVRGPGDILWSGCSSWRALLAFSFISSMFFLGSSLLGLYVTLVTREKRHRPAVAIRAIDYTVRGPSGPAPRGDVEMQNNGIHANKPSNGAHM